MKEREPLSLSFDPREIVDIAHLKIKEGRIVMSKNVAVALAMQDLGKNLLRETLDNLDMRLMDDAEIGLIADHGVGAIALGAIIFALEQGTVAGWNANVLRKSFNGSVDRLLIADELLLDTWEEEDFILGIDPKEEGRRIKGVLSVDKTFVSFFEPNTSKLPRDIKAFLDEHSNLKPCISTVLPFYKNAIRIF